MVAIVLVHADLVSAVAVVAIAGDQLSLAGELHVRALLPSNDPPVNACGGALVAPVASRAVKHYRRGVVCESGGWGREMAGSRSEGKSARRGTRKVRRPSVPRPPDPEHRHDPLPWEHPQPAEDDAGAAGQLAAILASPSYRPAVADTAFLLGADVRGARLQIDYLKPELTLRAHGVTDTVVVFGSTRIPEPKAAAHRVSVLATAPLARTERKAERAERLAVAQRVAAKSKYYDVAREFGRLVATARLPGGSRRRPVMVTGGGPGMMAAANRGAFDAGERSVGLNITLPREQFPNPYVSPELCFRFHYFAMRKLHFLLRARALVAFPGGFGTFDEVFETLTLVQTRKIRPIPVILVGRDYWSRAVDFDFLVDEGVIDPEDRDLFWFAETAREIWDGILLWYKQAEMPFLSGESAEDATPTS